MKKRNPFDSVIARSLPFFIVLGMIAIIAGLQVSKNIAFVWPVSYASTEEQSVFRFWSEVYQNHFFTISEAEKDFLIENDSNWKYEGIAYNAFTTDTDQTDALYRFYSDKFKGHFFTKSEAEKDFLIENDSNWKYEGIAYFVLEPTADTVPVYRFYSKKLDAHFYTTSETEKDFLENNDPNWTYEGIAFYARSTNVTDDSDRPDEDPDPVTACADGEDNDSDGKVDLLDPGCTNESDTDEVDPIDESLTPPTIDDGEIAVKAVAVSEDTILQLVLNGTIAHEWVIAKDIPAYYKFQAPTPYDISTLGLQIRSDDTSVDIGVDHIIVDSLTYQAEDPSVAYTGNRSSGSCPSPSPSQYFDCAKTKTFVLIPDHTLIGAVDPTYGFCEDVGTYGDDVGYNGVRGEECYLSATTARDIGGNEQNYCFDAAPADDGRGYNAHRAKPVIDGGENDGTCFMATAVIPVYESAPNTPTNLRATAQSETEITLEWDHPGADGFNLERDGSYYATISGGAKTYIDTSVVANQIYEYRVNAFNGSKFSPSTDNIDVRAMTLDTSTPPASKDTLPAAIRDDYDVVFYDEFNGTALDVNKWNTSFLWGPDTIINSEKQYYVDTIGQDQGSDLSPFSFDGNNLAITTDATPSGRGGDVNNQPYTSGLITSRDDFNFTYGYAESRVKVPAGQSFWPAFWLLNTNYVGTCPEIDIMELLGHQPERAYQTYHYFTGGDCSSRVSTESHVDLPSGGYDDEFHIFAVEWTPTYLQFYIDGVATNRIDDPAAIPHQDMYVLANLAVGGLWPGDPDVTTPFPSGYEVDWVRVYQKP